jgi:hypothetical protein
MDPDQPAHPRSLIRIHAVRLQTLLQVENSVDPDQTARMHRLVWIHVCRKPTMLVLSRHGSFIPFQNFNLNYARVLERCFTVATTHDVAGIIQIQ